MSQAAWNLCPQATAYGAGCYFQDDQTFDAAAGTLHLALPDIPDGTWSLVVKRDLMAKVGGAVRSTHGVERAGVWTKVGARGRGGAQEQQKGTGRAGRQGEGEVVGLLGACGGGHPCARRSPGVVPPRAGPAMRRLALTGA
jgi:hypothetical protein